MEFDSDHNKWKQIIGEEPTSTIVTTIFQPEEKEELKEGESLFHSHMCVNGTSLHFIVENESQKNLILDEVIKIMKLLIMPHSQLYTIRWLSRG